MSGCLEHLLQLIGLMHIFGLFIDLSEAVHTPLSSGVPDVTNHKPDLYVSRSNAKADITGVGVQYRK